MAFKDLLHRINVKKVAAPISGAGDDSALVGAIIDHQGFESATYVIQTGVISDADATFVALLEEGDNSALSDAAAVADADMISQVTGTAPEVAAAYRFDDDGEVRLLGYKGTKRYTRLTLTPVTNTGAWLIGVLCILSHARYNPPTQGAN